MSALAELTDSLTRRAAIGAEDVLAMRRLIWNDAQVSSEEAEVIMALNSACQVRSPEWIDYFVEVMLDYIVHQQVPQDYVDQAKADRLMHWIDKDGRVDSLSELELLIRILERAESAPESLKNYALQQIETAVLTGSGPTRQTGEFGGGALDPGSINAVEVELLRRILYAQSGADAYIVSASEAEMLFRLKDATLRANNAPVWDDLFVKGVANHLMAHRNYQTLSHDDQVKVERYEVDTHVSLGRFFGRMFGQGGAELPAAAMGISTQMNDEAAAAVDHAVTPQETQWVIGQIRADGRYDTLEKKLIAFIRAEMTSNL